MLPLTSYCLYNAMLPLTSSALFGGDACVINPESYTGASFSFWQVLPSQAGQRVGCRQIDDRIAGSRARVVPTGRYNLVYSG